MLQLFNTLGRKREVFHPVNERVVAIFTCGPSVYQRAHIGNFRTFLFEDVLVRYLEYLGYEVRRGMNLTDLEDKALREAAEKGMSLRDLTDLHIKGFLKEMEFLRIKRPDYLPRASGSVDEAVGIIEKLLDKKLAYWYKGNVYFDPLKFRGFGKLYGLDMSRWPRKKRRFHQDTYPGMQWNLGDFVLWHGYREGDDQYWETRIGRGRPSWNVQDPSMILRYFDETLSVYCGGVDNLFRHHDYTLAILESIRPYPMARFWLHCEHLRTDGQKMSKSKGNIYYTDSLLRQGFSATEIRFFLIYGHYRTRLTYSVKNMNAAAAALRGLIRQVRAIEKKAGRRADSGSGTVRRLKEQFAARMDDDLDVKGAFDALLGILSEIDAQALKPDEARGIVKTLREIDRVLQVVF